MENITSRLVKLDPTLKIHDEGEWSMSKSKYTAFNDAGVECEVGELLYSFVRVLKPDSVLETGTHWGIGASYMGMALKDNGIGHLDTIEFLPEIHAVAVERIAKIGLSDIVTCHKMDVRNFTPNSQYQMILLDTEPDLRFAEFVKFWDYLDDGGYLFIHDLHRHMGQTENEEHGFAWPFGKIPAFMLSLINTDACRLFHFPTPRGLTGFYKVHSGDFKTKSWREKK